MTKTLQARKFNAVVEIWQTDSLPDGYGGYVKSENPIFDIYARREVITKENYSPDAVAYDRADVAFVVRNLDINTVSNYIVYNGYRYNILRVERSQLETQIRLVCVSTNQPVEPMPSI